MSGPAPSPRNPHYAARVRDSVASQPLMSQLFGAVVERVEPGLVDLSLGIQPAFLQPHGNVHGVLASALADSAAGYAAQSLLGPEADVVTVEYKINFLAPGFGERLIARGRVLRAGRTLSICAADVFAIAAGEEKLMAHMVATMMTVEA